MKTLILLHGAIGAKDQLQPLAELLQNDFDVHSINFSGHGGEPLPNSFSIDLFSDNLLCYIEALDLKDVVVFGYSMGGYVALYTALHNPNSIAKIFTLGTKFKWNSEISEKETKMLNPEKIEEKIPHFAEQLKLRHSPNDWKSILEKTSKMMHDLGNENALKIIDLKNINIPVMVTLGDNDTMVTLEETSAVVDALSKAQFKLLNNTPHPIEKVNMSALTDELRGFMLETQ
jgi:pimeloyl-ACP methyl ester carboxylesterase